MTVEELMKILSRLPNDATVTVMNNDAYINGEFKATFTNYLKRSNVICIMTDYKGKVGK